MHDILSAKVFLDLVLNSAVVFVFFCITCDILQEVLNSAVVFLDLLSLLGS